MDYENNVSRKLRDDAEKDEAVAEYQWDLRDSWNRQRCKAFKVSNWIPDSAVVGQPSEKKTQKNRRAKHENKQKKIDWLHRHILLPYTTYHYDERVNKSDMNQSWNAWNKRLNLIC